MMSDSGAHKVLVERYEKIVFGFILSFAAFSREQAFGITVSSFIHTLKEMAPDTRDSAFLEGLFSRVVLEIESAVPGGDAGLSAFGDFPAQKKESIKIVREGFLQLSPEDKRVLLLRDQCHFSFERISGILGTKSLQAKSACLAAREHLREAVQVVLKKKAG